LVIGEEKEERKRRQKVETAAAKYGIAEFAGLENDGQHRRGGNYRTGNDGPAFGGLHITQLLLCLHVKTTITFMHCDTDD